MKTKFYLLLIVVLALSFSASAQRFGSDIVLHECTGDYWAKPKISVADNGWIYVMMNKYGHPTEKDMRIFYRSTDGGVTFQEISSAQTASGFKNAGRDFVVTGNDPSNISIWYLYAVNNTAAQSTSVYLKKMDANGQNGTTIVFKTYDNTKTYDVAIATNARSPETVWSPFTIGFAMTTYSIPEDRSNVDYWYSTDGGATFNKKWVYNKVGSVFGSIDLSIGQANASAYWPCAGVVFEMDKETSGLGNIGFQTFVADGYTVSDVLQVNKKYSSYVTAKEPKIQWLCNNTLNEPYNFMIAYSNYWNSNDWDIIKIHPEAGYGLGASHTLDNLDCKYIAGSVTKNEFYPDLSYDKNYNNYLLTYVENEGDKYVLKYKTQHYTKFDQGSGGWTLVGDVSSVSSGNERFFSPVVDIDLTRTEACFAFEYYHWGSPSITRLLFDSEWSTVDTKEIVSADEKLSIFPNPATNTINIKLQDSDKYSVKIIDFQGKLIKEVSFTGNQIKISLENMPAGIYMLKINSGKKQYTEKFIKSL
ncbi:MAG: T9SS type A sorting domain-containing protein [Lentimicrobiaceae bacterium]|nr:T9SS type A sorting domain-containing protein [Lentimicrobiaceae bacterium]